MSGNSWSQKAVLQGNYTGGGDSPCEVGAGLGDSLRGRSRRAASVSGEGPGAGAHLVGVGPVLVLGPVAGVAEGFAAALVFACVRLLARVRPQVRLQVLQARVRLPAPLKLRDMGSEGAPRTGGTEAGGTLNL